jgi:hypothetical protein
VNTFLQAGCEAYCACGEDPGGDEALVYAVNLLFHHLCRGESLEDAHARACAHGDQGASFRLSRGER